MEEFGTDSGVLLKASETCLSEWGQWVRHTFFWRGFSNRCMLHWKVDLRHSAKQLWEDSGFNTYVVLMSDELLVRNLLQYISPKKIKK